MFLPAFEFTSTGIKKLGGVEWHPSLIQAASIPIRRYSSRDDLKSKPKPDDANPKFITRHQYFRVHDALCFANYRGFVFNVELTFMWERAGMADHYEIDKAFQAFTDRLRSYLTHRKHIPYYFAVFENNNTAGCHTHMGLNLSHALRKDFKAWLGDTMSRGFDGHSLTSQFYRKHNADGNVVGQWEWFKYCMKSICPKITAAERQHHGDITFHQMAHLGHKPYFSGRLSMDRVRLSRSLGFKAQRKMGFIANDEISYDDTYFKRGQYERLTASIPTYDVPI